MEYYTLVVITLVLLVLTTAIRTMSQNQYEGTMSTHISTQLCTGSLKRKLDGEEDRERANADASFDVQDVSDKLTAPSISSFHRKGAYSKSESVFQNHFG